MSVVPLPNTAAAAATATEKPAMTSAITPKQKRKSIHKAPPSFFGVVLQALNPNTCMRACNGDVDQIITEEEVQVDSVLPDLLETISNNGEQAEQVLALEDLHKLVDKNHSQNRIPIVCTRKWNAVRVLANYISQTDNPKGRRQACLILNNLSIPFDNKAAIILGEDSELLLTVLPDIIRKGYPEAYLCCVCLMNLSILEDAKKLMLTHVPSKTSNARNALDTQTSLLSTMEIMMKTYRPFLLSDVVSVEGEAIRWAIGMFRNLCTNSPNAAILAQTGIPSLVAGFIRDSPHPLCKWKRDSLEDLGLALLVQLVHYPASLRFMRKHHRQIKDILSKIAGKKGIHGMRATMVSNHVNATN